MENILSAAKKVSESAEVYLISSEETSVQFEADKLKNIQSKQISRLALRIMRGGKTGYALASGLEASHQLVSNALETARFGADIEFEFPPLTDYPDVKIFDPETESTALERMIGLGNELISTVKQHTPNLQCSASVNRVIISVRLINSNGGQVEYKLSAFSAGIEGTLIRDTDMLFVGEIESSCRPLTETETITRNVIQQLERAEGRAQVAAKPQPVIFTPHGVASALISPLMSAFNGKTVLEGASPIGSRLGQAVFDSRLYLYDDATLAFRPASRPCDDEGVPSRRTVLIEAGVVRNFLYDLKTAAQANTLSTGNGDRGRGGLPAPSSSAFVMAPGDISFEEMVSDIREGIIIEHIIGAQQGNILNGDFSGNVLLGYKVENGKIAGRVKDTMVSGNVFRLLKGLSAIGNDQRWVGSSLCTPSLYCQNLAVASK